MGKPGFHRIRGEPALPARWQPGKGSRAGPLVVWLLDPVLVLHRIRPGHTDLGPAADRNTSGDIPGQCAPGAVAGRGGNDVVGARLFRRAGPTGPALREQGDGGVESPVRTEVRSPLAPWILYAIGTAARIATAATTGLFGYVGNSPIGRHHCVKLPAATERSRPLRPAGGGRRCPAGLPRSCTGRPGDPDSSLPGRDRIRRRCRGQGKLHHHGPGRRHPLHHFAAPGARVCWPLQRWPSRGWSSS